MPVWHASGAIQPVKPVIQWSASERAEVEEMLRGLIKGVGRERLEFFEDDHPEAIALHLRRPADGEEEDFVGGARDVRCEHGMGLWTPGEAAR